MIPVICLVLVASLCAIKAARAVRLLHSALWLAGVSAAVTIMLYLIGAYMMAVIELSLSVGLITILLVFAISMVGADSPDTPVSHQINLPLLAALLFLLLSLTLPQLPTQLPANEGSFSETFWQQREADVLAQISLIFAGVLGILGLLTEERKESQEERSEITEHEQPISQVIEDEAELEKI